VIGGGAAGITAAHLLQKKYAVTIFESSLRLGGHASAVENQSVLLDTAFLIFNEFTYPQFMRLIDELDVRSSIQSCEMSASFTNIGKNLHYALLKGMNEIFYQRKNLFNPAFYRLFLELILFRSRAYKDLTENRLGSQTLGQYVERYSSSFREDLVLPLTMAIWSIPAERVWDYPARSILQFFLNHRLLKGSSGNGWRSFRGSSRSYVSAFEKSFRGKVQVGENVTGLSRSERKVSVRTSKGQSVFDYLVIATHADDALSLLEDPSQRERTLLGDWTYFENQVVLHTDPNVMPKSPKLWSSWNIKQDGDQRSVTYHLNRVQKLDSGQDYFLTLGHCLAEKNSVIRTLNYRHPIYNHKSVETQSQLNALNGVNRSYYCGSYFGHGFHEDAVSSAVSAASLLGCGFD
jgi:predicted NAD/FAD-binding protein